MAYVAPTTRSSGFIVTASVWNQDVVENVLTVYDLLAVSPAVVYESNDDNYSYVAGVWTERRLNGVLRDPNGIILNQDFANYRFDLADGTYLTELMVFHQILNPPFEAQWSRIRDTDNNTTLTGTSTSYGTSGGGGDTYTYGYNYTFNKFDLANGANTTVQVQSYSASGSVRQRGILPFATTGDDDSKGAYQTILKLWKVA